MRAFVCEVDHAGLRRLLPEEVVLGDVLGFWLQVRYAWPTTVVWALLDDDDAEDLCKDVRAGRHRDACGLLLNRAVELISLVAATPATARGPR